MRLIAWPGRGSDFSYHSAARTAQASRANHAGEYWKTPVKGTTNNICWHGKLEGDGEGRDEGAWGAKQLVLAAVTSSYVSSRSYYRCLNLPVLLVGW